MCYGKLSLVARYCTNSPKWKICFSGLVSKLFYMFAMEMHEQTKTRHQAFGPHCLPHMQCRFEFFHLYLKYSSKYVYKFCTSLYILINVSLELSEEALIYAWKTKHKSFKGFFFTIYGITTPPLWLTDRRQVIRKAQF